jgi:lipopolysaccharide transport system ATP-binding protein
MSDSDVVIRVEGLGKKYFLHHEQSERYTSLRDVWARQVKAIGRSLNPFTLGGQLRKAQRLSYQENFAREEDFWALKDISFEIRRGERVGIIGRNGAGKSTLLKILSRITEPTTGRVEIRGRVASLLEVGTGFHPELTGRENIYLNGAILGMTRREIRSKFDEIVDFAEVEKFLDTPVKRYSSGMYVRLAFAVAAHLEPEILVVDEVLAVGDASFQKKCLNKMKETSAEEKTLLFVSHNIGTITSLCQKALLLQKGSLKSIGEAQKISEEYMASSTVYWESGSTVDLSNHMGRTKSSTPIFKQISITHQGKTINSVPMGASFNINIELKHISAIRNSRIGISIEDMSGNRIIAFSTSMQAPSVMPTELQSAHIECKVVDCPLMQGLYAITLILGNGYSDLDRVENAILFTIEPWDVYGTGQIPGRELGLTFAQTDWKLRIPAEI